MEISLKIHSSPTFGGDGLGIWFLDPVMKEQLEAQSATDVTGLSGAIFGMREDFQGLGIILDVYDNDQQRNNPAIFVIENNQKYAKFPVKNDEDYKNDMVTTMPDQVTGHTSLSSKSVYRAHR